MSEHTPTLVAGHIVTFFNGRERTPTDEAVIHLQGDEDSEIEIHCPNAPTLAATIVKAVNSHDALVKALEFYADPRRYNGANQKPIEADPYAQPGEVYIRDVTRDNGSLARSALAKLGA